MLFLFQHLEMAVITTPFSFKEKKKPFQCSSPISKLNDDRFYPYVEDPASLVPTWLSSH